MTRRKFAVIALAGLQGMLALMGMIFLILDNQFMVFASVIGSALVITAAFIYVWRSLERKNAAAHERVRQLVEHAPWSQRKDASAFDVGRAAGAETQVDLPAAELEDLLFGPRTDWYGVADSTPARIGVIGEPQRFAGRLPEFWQIDDEFVPGMLASHAERTNVGLILCDSSVFTRGVWRQAIDTPGEWIVADLYRLRRWVDRSGAVLALFNHGNIPVGVNTEIVRSAFNIEFIDGEPQTTVEGAPIPKAMAELHKIAVDIAPKTREVNR